jgi:hypothetical protein
MDSTIYCKKCGSALSLCQCGTPEFTCGTCDSPIGICKCNYEEVNHQCEFCMAYTAKFQEPKTGFWICYECLQKPVVRYRLENQ